MTPSISPAVLGFLRAIGTVVLFSIVSYLANAANLNGIFSPTLAAIVAACALALEHKIEGTTGKALFGFVVSK